MTPSALIWFIDLTARYEATPNIAQRLGQDLENALKSKNARIQISRVFRHTTHKDNLPAIYAWLNDDVRLAVEAKNCALTREVFNESVSAFQQILSGSPASAAWKLGNQRGVDAGFSKTLDAIALIEYLAKNSDLGYSRNRAIQVGAKMFGIREDTIRQYDGTVEFVSNESEAMCAYFALVKHGLLDAADEYFDTEELRDFRQPRLKVGEQFFGSDDAPTQLVRFVTN